MLQRGNALACFQYLGTVKIGNNDRSMNAAFSQDLAPWRNNQAVPERLPTALVLARLRGGEDEAASFDGTRADQHMPMGLTGGSGEGRRNRQKSAPALASAR